MEDVTKIDLSKGKSKEAAPQVEETVNETPQAEEPKVEEKVIPTNEHGDYVLNLNKEEDAVQQVQEEPKADEDVLRNERVAEPTSEEKADEVSEEKVDEQPEVVQATSETVGSEQPITSKTSTELPEDLVKLQKFMEETGGTLQDFVELNKDIDSMDESVMVKEFYKEKYKGRYDDSEIDFLLNRDFSYDEELDSEEDIMAKKLKIKDAIFEAKEFFADRKDKYYTELKSRKFDAVEDPNYLAYKENLEKTSKQQEYLKQIQDDFNAKTTSLLSDNFEGFGFKLGDNLASTVKVDPVKTRELQMNANNIFSKFYDKNGILTDAEGYHKALNAASDPDKLAKHFYELGKADAVKTSAKEAKNIDMSPRQDSSSVTSTTGQKFKIVSGDSKGSIGGKIKLQDY